MNGPDVSGLLTQLLILGLDECRCGGRKNLPYVVTHEVPVLVILGSAVRSCSPEERLDPLSASFVTSRGS